MKLICFLNSMTTPISSFKLRSPWFIQASPKNELYFFKHLLKIKLINLHKKFYVFSSDSFVLFKIKSIHKYYIHIRYQKG